MKKVLYISLAMLLVLASCDILETRSSEEPETSRANFVPATTPDILFQNMVSAFNEKIVENYTATLVDDAFINREFRFIPAAETVQRFAILSDWDINSETQYFNNAKAVSTDGAPIVLNLFNETSNLLGDSASYQFDYTINLPNEEASVPDQYEGSVRFKIFLDSRNQWVIVEWEDISDSEAPTWSELKGRFY